MTPGDFLRAIGHALGAPFRVFHAAFRALLDAEGRRAWAVLIAFGCGVAMTALSTAALWLDRTNSLDVFWLGTEAMGINLVVITAFTGLLVKRDIGGSLNLKEGSGNISIRDSGGSDGNGGDSSKSSV